ncbi:hypothetical protein RB195_012750 [Necator americanus]
MVVPEGDTLTLGVGGFSAAKRLSPAPYKHIPVYPLRSPAVNLSHCNISPIRPSCSNCFPEPVLGFKMQDYVDLLEFSRYGGIPHPILPGARPPSPWFADLRYSLTTPLPHSYPSVYKEVIESDKVAAAVVQGEKPSTPMLKAKRNVKTFFSEIHASLSRFICKICGYILFKVFRRLMTRLLVCPAQMKRLVDAEKTGIPLVYLPLHRSHLDYLLITWSSWHFGLRLPHIASGDNLNLNGLGWLLRATGAFFIRRRTEVNDNSGKDVIYRAVLHSYVEQLLKKGLCIEFFLEGTRCRFGKPLLPKHGLISNVITSVQQKVITDCYLVPVSYTYDSVAEGVFLDELIGVSKKRESVVGVITGIFKSFGKSKRCGAVRMHYGKPVLLSDYLNALKEALTSREGVPELTRIPNGFAYRELLQIHGKREEKADDRTLVRSVGYHLIYEAQSIVSISLVSVVSALLMCKFRQGVSIEILSADCQWLCEQIIHDGSEVMGWHSGETCGRNVVEYGLQYMRDSVERLIDPKEGTDNIFLINNHRQLINMAYNKNALVPLFALRSAIGLVMVSRPSPLLFNEALNDVALICDLMQVEVIFCKPCEDLRAIIAAAIGSSDLSHVDYGLLRLEGDEKEFDGEINPKLEVRDAMSLEILVFYSNFLRPFMQSLYLVIERLLAGDSITQESHTIRLWCRKSIAGSTHLPFPLLLEAVNSDSFRNSLRLLRCKGILTSDSKQFDRKQAEKIRDDLLRLLTIN